MEENQNEHIHEEFKEKLKIGDADEQLKNCDTGKLNNTEIRISKRQKQMPITRRRFFMDSKVDNNRVLGTSGGSNINHNPQWNNLFKSCNKIDVENIHNTNQQPVYQSLKIF